MWSPAGYPVGQLVADLLAAGSAALGTALTRPSDLGGSDRSKVLRCHLPAGGTVVIKSYPPTADGAEGLAAEAAGLAFCARTGLGPELLAVDAAARLIVMADLGDAPSLADLLLGQSADAAERALLDWVRACGRLAASTAGRRPEFAQLRSGYLAAQADLDGADEHWLARRIGMIPGLLSGLGIGVPGGLAGDLAAVLTLLGTSFEVFSPGDICPDNNLITADGVRFVDYESAEFHSVFLDAAYLRMPFSSCWCVFRLPGRLARAAESCYRDHVCAIYPQLADDQRWEAGVRLAMAAWTLHAMSYLLDRSMLADKHMHDLRRPVPTARQLLRFRWRRLADELAAAGELSALAETTERLLAATWHWATDDLPVYPAFRAPLAS